MLSLVFCKITENHFQVKIKDCMWVAYEVEVKFKTPFIWHKFHSNLYVCIVLCILKNIFSKKKYLKAISKVDVNFNKLHIKFNMQSLKKWFLLILQKTMFNWWKSEIQ